MHKELLQVLKIFYENYNSKLPLYLEGGALCCGFWGVDREFSGDVDFTTSIEEIDKVMNYYISKCQLILDFKKISDNAYELYLEKSTLNIDIYFAPAENCEYASEIFEGVEIRCHSLQDMLAEKACCMMSRNKENDRKDFEFLIKNKNVDWMKFSELLKKKIHIKNI